MSDFRAFVDYLHEQDELLRVPRTVASRFELSSLLKQAEQAGKAILFESVDDSTFPVVGGVFSSVVRFFQSLSLDAEGQGFREHAELVSAAIANPVAPVQANDPSCKYKKYSGADVDCSRLPVPRFFEGDTGPFITAAIGISRNPDNYVLNAGFYRVLLLEKNQLGVSVSPGSDLHGFIQTAGRHGKHLNLALVIGADPALYMAAAGKVPANISELAVAGALQGEPLQVVKAEDSDLLVPASAEFVIELEINPGESIDNTMGEFGDLYGTQRAFMATVTSITHRHSPVFHVIMAGAGREHNSLGFIILYGLEPELRKDLSVGFPEVQQIKVVFDPPRMGSRGDVFVALSGGRKVRAEGLFQHIYSLACGGFPLQRVIRRIVLVDTDINLKEAAERQWVVASRATRAADYMQVDAPGGSVCIGVDARGREGEERLRIPGSEAIRLDDYLE